MEWESRRERETVVAEAVRRRDNPRHSLKEFGALSPAMPKRYCKCPNDHCFDRAIQCGSCDPEDLDPEGYPSKARRRLTNEDADGMVVDIDTKQKFKVKKVKGGKRLLPQFKGPVDWKSAKGFAAMCLILSCLGAEGEYVLWDENTNAEMSEKEWRRRRYISTSKPPVRHPTGLITRHSVISTLARGEGIRITWKDRYSEFKSMLSTEHELEVDEPTWQQRCNDKFIPPVKHRLCNTINTSTTIGSFVQGSKWGCFCSGRGKTRMTDPQFYTALTSKEVCNRLGWYQKFHGPQAKLSFPSRDEFVSTVLSYPESNRTVHNVKILVKCQVCTASQKASLHSLQGNHGISCICDKMSYSDPQYYDLIHDKRVCQTLSMFAALHQEEKTIVLPSRTTFYEAISTQSEKASAFISIPDVKCSWCGCISDALLANLRQNQGIACFCSGRMSVMCSLYYDCMCNAELCLKLGVFAAFHRYEPKISLPSRAVFYDAVREGGAHAKIPGLYCTVCNEVVDTTSLFSLHNNQGIRCGCQNKTEVKIYKWLENEFATAVICKQYRGPKTDRGGHTHFDFHLSFLDGFEVLIELDGPQHFWCNKRWFDYEGCQRDLIKEKWAVAKGISVVRVLQEDVWEDKLGWQGWLTKSIENARTGEASIFTPDAPEYQAANSAYVQLRARS
jgi:hypothetical protein